MPGWCPSGEPLGEPAAREGGIARREDRSHRRSRRPRARHPPAEPQRLAASRRHVAPLRPPSRDAASPRSPAAGDGGRRARPSSSRRSRNSAGPARASSPRRRRRPSRSISRSPSPISRCPRAPPSPAGAVDITAITPAPRGAAAPRAAPPPRPVASRAATGSRSPPAATPPRSSSTGGGSSARPAGCSTGQRRTSPPGARPTASSPARSPARRGRRARRPAQGEAARFLPLHQRAGRRGQAARADGRARHGFVHTLPTALSSFAQPLVNRDCARTRPAASHVQARSEGRES